MMPPTGPGARGPGERRLAGSDSSAISAGVLAGDRLALSRALTLIENREKVARKILSAIFPKTGRAGVIGMTGPPGAGKSTLVDQLIRALRAKGKRVAVAAVDPSSPFSGGAVLGDRIRMQEHAADPGVFIRSLGTRGQHGGLALATREFVMAFDAAGFDWILVETAGVGQTELAVAGVAQTVCVVLVPESGDSIQVMKAGLMEIADVFAVNKADRPEADKIVRELTSMVSLAASDSWQPPIVKTEAVRGEGVADLLVALEKHQSWLRLTGRAEEKSRAFLRGEVEDILREKLARRLEGEGHRGVLTEVFLRRLDPYEAASRMGRGI